MLAALMTVSTALQAQGIVPSTSSFRDSTERPRIRFDRGLKLDGVLTDAAWARADSLSSFTQSDPRQGEPVTERTVVRFVGSADGLWIGVWAYDREPSAIRRTQLRRDADLDDDDNISVMLSPIADKRTAFIFSTNPNGALNDAEVLNFEDESTEWDGIWDARARVTSDGWHAEILIPWQTLRYRSIVGADAGDSWDINVRRFIRRKNETALWTAWKRTEGIRFLERAGSLSGFTSATQALEKGLPRRAIAELRPYLASTGSVEGHSVSDDGTLAPTTPAGVKGTGGVDAKLAPSPTLTLDLTVNADFAQADVDRQVVNLTRFSLFFPERRQFFTEGSGIYEFGRREQTQLFYSRRIGLDENGLPIPLLAGARLSGRIGAQQIGFLSTHTGGDDPSTAVVGRVKRDVLGRGFVGAMGTLNAPNEGSASVAGGVDMNLPYVIREQNLVFIASAAADGSETPGDPYFFRGAIDFPNDIADIVFRFDRVGEGFNPDLGFVQQRGITRMGWSTEITPRPSALGAFGRPFRAMGVRQLKFEPLGGDLVRTMGVTGPLTGLSNGELTMTPLGLEFDSGDEVAVEFSRQYDVPQEPFDLFEGAVIPAGRYQWDRAELQFESSGARMLAIDFSVSTGGFYTGHSTEFGGGVRGRFAPHVNVSLDYELTKASVATEDSTVRFTAQTVRAQLDVASSPRLSTSLFAQYDNESDRGSINARLRWTQSPGTDFYVVWTSQWPTGLPNGIPWKTPTRGTLVAKFVKYFRV